MARHRLACARRTTRGGRLHRFRAQNNSWESRDMLQVFWEQTQARPSLKNARERLPASIGLAVAICVAYFLAARLSLFLQTEPDGVAVFWPAAGVSSGILIALGRDVRLHVAIGVVAATVVANLTSDRTVWSSIAFALCNAGEALL